MTSRKQGVALDPAARSAILQRLLTSNVSQRALAREFNVAQSTITKINRDAKRMRDAKSRSNHIDDNDDEEEENDVDGDSGASATNEQTTTTTTKKKRARRAPVIPGAATTSSTATMTATTTTTTTAAAAAVATATTATESSMAPSLRSRSRLADAAAAADAGRREHDFVVLPRTVANVVDASDARDALTLALAARPPPPSLAVPAHLQHLLTRSSPALVARHEEPSRR